MTALCDPPAAVDLRRRVDELRRERNAVILAHNYQLPEIQDVADVVGDSLGLSQAAARTDADVIAFCGVHFMAETAAILSPQRVVLLPDLAAGCSLADTITPAQLRAWKAEHPGAVVVSYVNTSAAVKAESDYCCTSANAAEIVRRIPEETEVLFCPDMFLGEHVRRVTGRRNMHVWMGECHVHAGIDPEDLEAARATDPDAELLVHPECGCTTSALYRAANGELGACTVTSTEGMMARAAASPASTFIVATEVGIIHRLAAQNPRKRFVPASRDAVCRFMKMITLEKLVHSLETMSPRVTVDEATASRARAAIDRMIGVAA
ncbi:MAG TPA: quinolinate synthase NadA [Candidatus Dormibacteraeota bacterium]|nr:quinolinate synthase NadA [Candidatus Dormibacteraeota bacterium]